MRINKKKTFFSKKKIANVCWKTVLDKKPTGLFVPGPRKSAPRGTSKPINREGRKKEEQTPKTTKVSFLSAQQKRKNQDIKSHVVVGGGGRARRGHKLWRNNTTKTIRYPSSSTLQLALLLFLHLAFSGRKRKRVENFLSKRRRLFFFLHPFFFFPPSVFFVSSSNSKVEKKKKCWEEELVQEKLSQFSHKDEEEEAANFLSTQPSFFPLFEKEREKTKGDLPLKKMEKNPTYSEWTAYVEKKRRCFLKNLPFLTREMGVKKKKKKVLTVHSFLVCGKWMSYTLTRLRRRNSWRNMVKEG